MQLLGKKKAAKEKPAVPVPKPPKPEKAAIPMPAPPRPDRALPPRPPRPAGSPKIGAVRAEVKPGEVSVRIGRAARSKPSVTVSVFDSGRPGPAKPLQKAKPGFRPPGKPKAQARPKPAASGKPRIPGRPTARKPRPEPKPGFGKKEAQPPSGKKELKDIRKTVAVLKKSSREMAEDIKAVKSKARKMPEKKHIEEIKKIIRKTAEKKAPPRRKARAKRKKTSRRPAAKARPTVGEEIKDLKGSARMLDKSISRVARDILILDSRMTDVRDEARESAKAPDKGPLSESDIKSLKGLLAKAGYFDAQVASLQVKLDNLVNVVDAFAERFNSIQKDFAEIKARKEPRPAGGKDAAELASRMDEMEAVLEKMSERAKESRASAKPESKEAKAALGRISALEESLGEIKGKMAAFDNISKLKDLKDQLTPESAERAGNADSRIAAITDKIIQVGSDVQKLSDHFLDGMRHMDSRLKSLETRFTEREGRDMMKERAEAKPRFRTYYDTPMSMPAPPPRRESPEPFYAPAMMPPPRRELSGPPFPAPSAAVLPPPSPPAESTIFTKLRESTVERRPFLQQAESDDDDMDIISEHITDSMRRGESAEKIRRDLLNAGFDEDIISRALTQVRAG